MKRIFSLVLFFIVIKTAAQNDSSIIISTPKKPDAIPVKIFNSERTVNANTTEIVSKGYMEFKVTHNFDDIAVKGNKNFIGLDNSTDVRIGFMVGLTDRLNVGIARAKGGGVFSKTRVNSLYELSLKYQLARQLENDPSHPISIAIFANNVVSATRSEVHNQVDSLLINNPPTPSYRIANDTFLNNARAFRSLGERTSQVLQLIMAKKIGRSGFLVNATLVHHAYVPLHDQKTIFALGGTVRLPLGKSINLLVDYIHPFRSEESKNYFKNLDASYNHATGDIDRNKQVVRFRDPVAVGFEILTEGHVFHLNFTNARDILDNRLIPYTTSRWGKGEFRWAFNISRKFALKKSKYYQ